ncbi:histidine kinase dimerization/phosphoacceptor domain -containing protein [Candidatus Magnetominusculus xianensis]|nr:histidine kinase dimerization/phosphoacceptor domain -containing protein [Candidatus Magnetominusculus xianensis]MBF0405038.1 response regulator [Nitrospirota bacterium]
MIEAPGGQVHKKLTILYVEDDAAARKALSRFLSKNASQVFFASDGMEGLELYNMYKPEIVITDIRMPVMDGLAMSKSIKEVNPDAFIIVTTSHNDIEFLMSAINIGVDKYIVKPVKFEILKKMLAACAEAIYRQREIIKLNEALMASLTEKEVLLREIHHRVKNNMQVISSLLRLQARYVKDNKLSAMFKDSEHRIRSMALIHEKLYNSKDLSRIDFGDYVKNLCSGLFSSYGVNKRDIRFNVDTDEISMGIDTAIPCGLIINELISNSLKYAFKKSHKGEISVRLRKLQGNEYELTVGDTGVGLDEDIDFRTTESLGLQLVTSIAESQLHGKITLDRTKGTVFRIKFDELKYATRI